MNQGKRLSKMLIDIEPGDLVVVNGPEGAFSSRSESVITVEIVEHDLRDGITTITDADGMRWHAFSREVVQVVILPTFDGHRAACPFDPRCSCLDEMADA